MEQQLHQKTCNMEQIDKKYFGTFDWYTSSGWKSNPIDRFSKDTEISTTLLASGNQNGVIEEVSSMTEKEYEVCDFRYDEGLRSRVETQVVPTLTTHSGTGVSGAAMVMENESVDKVIENVANPPMNLRIRKLTPRECWRLMGFSERRPDGTWNDEAFENASKVNSNAQLYKQAGNSIVVDCLEAIFQNLFLEPDHTEYREVSLF